MIKEERDVILFIIGLLICCALFCYVSYSSLLKQKENDIKLCESIGGTWISTGENCIK